MEGELHNFVKVWLSILVSLCYCYSIGKITPKGFARLFSILPIICLFLLLPLNLNSVILSGTTGFIIARLANFKLLLFAFDKGPLSTDPSISLPRFLALASLPIKIQANPPQKRPRKTKKSIAIKVLVLSMFVRVFYYSDHLCPKVVSFLYCVHSYFVIERTLDLFAVLARALLVVELEPYLSTSLQDFWGTRWNLPETSVLRTAVYELTHGVATCAVGPRWAQVPAVLGTFLVSALMHELTFYYMGRAKPTWEITWFLLLHGVCVVAEVGLEKAVKGRWRLPRLISTVLTVGFVMVTSYWVLLPPLVRYQVDVRAFEEYAAVGEFFKKSIFDP
ncbi:hypothetical protein HS088_TW21G00695 [Tripterygium wilfordii]|uniref:Wax synthase domain-containing protein n=1 Tax=Tripterygium wilfordii TaxID=458696 RepID=A0A7J7C3X2_TRIWF|nr:acyl-CoA--sterol O-acyltransferase 1-like [Tripterygium wilfordii]KAF5728547.1 hypothetical protein HS088_TW21G00695 [Tripterygium wilfordii]